MMASSFLGQRAVCSRPVFSAAPRVPFTVEAAHKKGAGSTKNGRDSQSKRRGCKVLGGQPVKAGGIIYRQTGSTWYPGENVGQGKDYTLFSTIEGIVIYQKRPDRDSVHVFPMEHEKAVAAVKATHTKEAGPEGSRRERRRAQYTSRKQQPQPAVSIAAVVLDTKP